LEKKWREASENQDAPLPRYIKIAKLFNNGPFGLKEHAVAAITASSASNGTASIEVFTTQNLYYPDNPLSPLLVILATLSIGLFGYGLTGLFRPLTVDNAESVYWSQIPLLSLLQNLHWSDLRTSKKLRWFWYAFGFMSIYQIIPGYMFPWLNSVSIPCLAAMHATGAKATILTNIFGGSLNNEGLGILNFSFDWQYVSIQTTRPQLTFQITSFSTSLPLVRQANLTVGILICYVAMIAVYYGNAWGGRSLPFMSTRLLQQDGSPYVVASVFDAGVLNRAKLDAYGLPWLTSTYTWASVVGNMAVSRLSLDLDSIANVADWRIDRTLYLLLGSSDRQDRQRPATRRLARSTSPGNETVQGYSLVVVYHHHGHRIRLWTRRRPQVERWSRCWWIRRCSRCRSCDCAFRKCSNLQIFPKITRFRLIVAECYSLFSIWRRHCDQPTM
jgi:hypothetical protein